MNEIQLRDLLAAAALASIDWLSVTATSMSADSLACRSYEMADAMLRARDRESSK